MSLLSKFLPKKEVTDYFLTLGVEERRIRAALAQIKGEVITILGTGESSFSEGENESEAADMAISAAENQSKQEILIEKVIFSLPMTYLDGDSVRPEYLDRLKKITKDLNLKPHGFIEYPSAIAFSLERDEGSPATALLLHMEKSHITFSLIRVGKIYKNIVIPRGESITEDLEKTIPQFNTEIMPSRILLFDSSEQLDHLRTELLRFPWHKQSSFLHMPKVEILTPASITTALVQAAGSSFLKTFTLEFSKSFSHSSIQKETEKSHKKEPDAKSLEKNIRADTVNEIEPPPSKEPEPKHTKPEPVQDVSTKTETPSPPKGEEEDFGFVQYSDVQIKEKKDGSIIETTEVETAATIPEPEKKSSRGIPFAKNIRNMRVRLPSVHIPSLPFGPFLLLIPTVLLLIGTVYYLSYRVPEVSVGIMVYPLTQSNTVPVTFKTDASSSEDPNIIPAKVQTIEVSGDKTAAATGKSKIGEKASGEILIYNKTTSSKTFPKGTVLTSGSLSFTLDSDTAIASSSETGEGLIFGKITTKASAVSIGPDSNIPSNTTLKFKDYSENSFTAKSSQTFSGGTSREIGSISKEDQTNLEISLTNDLIAKARQQISDKLSKEDKLLDAISIKQTTNRKFSKEVGAEAKDLTLNLALAVVGYSYHEDDALTLAKNHLGTQPAGYILAPGSISIQAKDLSTTKDNTLKAQVKVSASYLPDFQLEDLKKKITGKSFDDATSYLRSIQGIGGVKITIDRPNLLSPKRLPNSPDHITITIASL